MAGIGGIIVSLLIAVSLCYRMAEPWVSCQEISKVLNQTDQSHSPVLASKAFARGVRFYTQRDVAVIDMNGKGFFSQHPVVLLNNDQIMLNFLKQQPVTYGIVRKSNVKDLNRIAENGAYTMNTVAHIGDKYLIKIDRPVKF